MTYTKYHVLALAIGAILAGCTTNKGGFETDAVTPTKTVSADTTPTAPTDVAGTPRPSDETLEALMEPSLGAAIKIPMRNTYPNLVENEANLNSDNIITLTDGTLDIPFVNELTSTNGSSGWVTHTHDGYGDTHKRKFDYVRSGYVQDIEGRYIDRENKTWYRGANGYVYYRGINPATHLPVGQTVTYKGTWDFVTDAKKDRVIDGFEDLTYGVYTGDHFGATSAQEKTQRSHGTATDGTPYAIGHSSEFQVDFGNKTLSGKLTKNDLARGGTQSTTERYTVDAKLHGNRFRGTATATNPNDPLFGKNSSSLEGGFFGAHAEELAGKFMADDSSVFGVFAAKQENKADTEAAFDAHKIHVGSDLALTKGTLDTFGNATQLVIDGKAFSLLPSATNQEFAPILNYDLGNAKTLRILGCCQNLDYVKLGSYFYRTDDVNTQDYTYFITGERTSAQDVARQTGTAYYKGTWAGTLVDKTGQHRWIADAGNPASASRADLSFDFSGKTFSGSLFAAGGVNPVLTLGGQITGNGFSGTANTGAGGFNLDGGSTGASAYVNINNATVTGGFYGPNAQEVGGHIYKNTDGEDKIGVVFGGKRQTQ